MQPEEYDVLDRHGKIKLLDIMGDELSIVNAARICTGSESHEMTDRDLTLLKYLIDNKHTSPLEMVKLKFYVKCPIFVARQWLRHRTISVNEKSQRYCDMSDTLDFYIQNTYRKQDTKNRQSSIARDYDPNDLTDGYCKKEIENICTQVYTMYKQFINMGICREQARMILPLCTMTEFIFIQDLHNLLHFIELRAHPNAQKEIQEYAYVIRDKIIKDHFPNIYKFVFTK